MMPRSWLSLVRACCPSAAVAVTAWLLVAVPSSAQPQLASQGPSRDRPPASAGLWISASEMAMLPAEGPAWEHLLAQAAQPCGEPDLGDQNDQTNVCVMAKALVATRTGNAVLRGAVLEALARIADGTPYRGRALALGRELAAYVIAADVIDLQHVHAALDHKLRARLRELLTTPTTQGPASLVECHEKRPNNWGTHCGASRAAVAAYLRDEAELRRAAAVFKGYLGERAAYAGFSYGDLSWQCDPGQPVGINPAGCLKDRRSVDGVLPDDQRRGGPFHWPPPRENYVYEGLQGALVQAVILHRAGYDAFNWADQALLRAFRWLHDQAGFAAVGDDVWAAHVVNHYYRSSFPAAVPARAGKNVGWTDWTHGTRPAAADRQTPGHR
jgi:hypothetical protein